MAFDAYFIQTSLICLCPGAQYNRYGFLLVSGRTALLNRDFHLRTGRIIFHHGLQLFHGRDTAAIKLCDNIAFYKSGIVCRRTFVHLPHIYALRHTIHLRDFLRNVYARNT